MKNNLVSTALKVTSPVFFGYITIGIGFGILLSAAGYPWWLATLMCLVLYTGSGQYFAVGLLAGGAKLTEILLVELLLSIRHIFYGLSLITKYKGTGKFKLYLIYSITDETFALIQGINIPDNINKPKFYLAVSALDQFYWTLGSTIGAIGYSILAYYNLSQYLNGVDFALTSLFIVLLIEQIKAAKDFIPATIGVACTALFVTLYLKGIIISSNIIWMSICTGLGIMLLLRGPGFFASRKKQMEELLK